MKKTMMFIVFSAILLVSVSAHTDKVVDATNGYSVPALTLESENNNISLNELKGKYVLLTFWSSTDAISRVACNEYTAFEKDANAEEQFCFLSVNFDKCERLFREIVRRDNLKAETQFYVQGDNMTKIKNTFHLEDGYKSFLIDPIGRIIATNPSTATLKKILSL